MVLLLLAFLATVLVVLITYVLWCYKYWERLGVPYLEPKFPFGNVQNIFRLTCSFGENAANQYKIAKEKGYSQLGLYSFLRPEYMPIDLEIVKNMMVKDFNYFCDRGFRIDEKGDPLSGHLFLLRGEKWRKIRSKLTPTFTSGKMRMMFNVVVECSKQLKRAMDVECNKGPLDIKSVLERFGTDVIGSCAFGLDCNSFTDVNSDFCKVSKRIFEPTTSELFKDFCGHVFPSVHKFFRMKIIPADVTYFFLKTVRTTIQYRNLNNVVRKDLLQIMIDLMKGDSGLTIEEIAAHSFVFFAAGFESSSNVISFCLLELSLNQEIQDKLREEVVEVMERHNNVVSYDFLKDLVYMNQCLEEVLRKYPPLPVLNRICTADYKVPNSNFVLKKDTRITIPILGIQNDPEHFPEPEKFDPDRFSPENKEKMNPFSCLPFGEGPRSCIGLRFAFMQMKTALSSLIINYKFSVNDRTQLPLRMKPQNFVLTPVGSIWLNVQKL